MLLSSGWDSNNRESSRNTVVVIVTNIQANIEHSGNAPVHAEQSQSQDCASPTNNKLQHVWIWSATSDQWQRSECCAPMLMIICRNMHSNVTPHKHSHSSIHSTFAQRATEFPVTIRWRRRRHAERPHAQSQTTRLGVRVCKHQRQRRRMALFERSKRVELRRWLNGMFLCVWE